MPQTHSLKINELHSREVWSNQSKRFDSLRFGHRCCRLGPTDAAGCSRGHPAPIFESHKAASTAVIILLNLGKVGDRKTENLLGRYQLQLVRMSPIEFLRGEMGTSRALMGAKWGLKNVRGKPKECMGTTQCLCCFYSQRCAGKHL
jgi:hypothetical protein